MTPNVCYHHPDPDIDAGVRADALEAERWDLAAGYEPRWWVCPQCATAHHRGHFLAVGQHRCLRCGYVGDLGMMHTNDPRPAMAEGRRDDRPHVPADPREALTPEQAVEKALLFTFQLSGKDYRAMQTAMSEVAFIRALEQDGYTLAARQDEPSPALRAVHLPADFTVAETIEAMRDAGPDVQVHLPENFTASEANAVIAALAANPPQTREAEGAASRKPKMDDDCPDFCSRWPGCGHTEADFRATPEAQRDAEPPDPLGVTWMPR